MKERQIRFVTTPPKVCPSCGKGALLEDDRLLHPTYSCGASLISIDMNDFDGGEYRIVRIYVLHTECVKHLRSSELIPKGEYRDLLTFCHNNLRDYDDFINGQFVCSSCGEKPHKAACNRQKKLQEVYSKLYLTESEAAEEIELARIKSLPKLYLLYI